MQIWRTIPISDYLALHIQKVTFKKNKYNFVILTAKWQIKLNLSYFGYVKCKPD